MWVTSCVMSRITQQCDYLGISQVMANDTSIEKTISITLKDEILIIGNLKFVLTH